MGMVARIVEEPQFVTDDDDITYRTAKVRLPNGREAQAFIHDTPGDWYRYNLGDRVRLSSNDGTNDGASGWVIIGKFTDDFEPVNEKNREIHGPKDASLVLRSRKDLDIDAKGTVQLGTGDAGDKSPIAIQSEVESDLDALLNLHTLIDATLKLLAAAVANPAASAAAEAYSKLLTATSITSQGAENVNAKPGTGV